jgi:ParB family transcriptional regulator, chromosome partitioning protein
LCEPVQEMLMHNKIDMGHARALIGLESAQQVMLANRVVQEDLSVREVEKATKVQQNQTKVAKPSVSHDVLALQERLSQVLGAQVSIVAKNNGSGSLKVSYSDLDQLDDLIAKLMPN